MKKLLRTLFVLLLLCCWGEAVWSQCTVEAALELTKATFPAQNDGRIVVTALSGKEPIVYSINNLPPQTSGEFTGLAPGAYTIKINDGDGCETILEAVLELDCITLTEESIIIGGVDGPICLFTSGLIQLTANVPDGQFTGPGVIDDFFNPQDIGIAGVFPINYRGFYMGCEFDKFVMVEIVEDCCPTPNNLTVDVLSPNQVNVSWDMVSGAINTYIVTYYPLSDPTDITNKFVANTSTILTDFPINKGNRWEVKVRVLCTDTDTSEYTVPIAFRLTEVICILPDPLSVENITSTGATLKWTNVPNVISYTVEYYPVAQPNDKTSTIVGAGNSEINATGLIPDTQYQFRVQANCEDNKVSGFTFPKDFKTNKDLTVCNRPTTVAIDDVRQTTARVIWSAVEGAFSYRVCARKAGETNCNVFDNTVQVTSLNLTGLQPETQYEVFITTDCGGILSETTPTRTFTTPPVVPPCPTPQNVKITNISTNFARVTWDHNPNVAGGYDLRYRRVGEITWRDGLFTGRPPFNLNRLDTDTEYEVQVRTLCLRGDTSVFTETIKFTTAPDPNCNPPREVVIVETTTTTAKIDWTRVGNADRYMVSYRVKGSNANFTESLVQQDSVILTNLAPNTLYEVIITVFCKNGKESDQTPKSEFRTQLPSINCPTPNNIEFTNITGASATVSWNPVANAIRYRVFYKKVNGTSLPPAEPTENFTTLEGLEAGTTYEVQIQSVCAGNNTSPLTLSNFVTTLNPNGCSGWTKSIGQNGDDRGIAVATDANGNAYTTGAFAGTLQLGNTTLTSEGQLDIFIVKYDFAGNIVWAKSAGSTASDGGFAIDVNSTGEVFVTGFISGEAKFDNIVIPSAGFTDVFVAKYSTNGTALWAQRGGGNTRSIVDANISDAGYGIVADNAGGCYVAGKFVGDAVFGPGGPGNSVVLTSASPTLEDAFVAKISSAGNYVWAKSYGGNSYDAATGIDMDADNNLWVSGIFAGQSRFSNINVSSNVDTTTDAFLAKLDSDGNAIDVKAYGGRGHDGAVAVGVDESNEAYITGYFVQNMTVGSQNLASRGDRDVFALKVNNNMSPLWAVSGGSSVRDEVTALSVDNIGSVYLTGATGGQFPFGDFTAGRAGRTDMYIVQLNASNGRSLNVKTFNTDTDFEMSRGIATNRDGLIYITGEFRNEALISNNRVTAVAGLDAFTAKFCDLGNPKPTCPATKFFLFDDITNRSVKIAWDPVVNTVVGGYVIYIRVKGSQTWQLRPVSNTPSVLSGLVGNTEYEVAIRTVCSVGDTSDFTVVNSFRTLPGNNCPAPGIITLDNVTENSVSIIWVGLPEAQTYEIQYRWVDSIPDFITWGTTANNFATITGLKKDRRYEVRVKSICSETAVSDFSPLTRFTTTVGTCAIPLNLKITATTRNSISVSWSPTADAIRYVIQWRRKGVVAWTSFTTQDTFLRITNLLPDTEYDIRVGGRCLGVNNNSPFNDPITGRTGDMCTVPTGIQITDLTGTRAEISWNSAPAAISYEVDFRRAGETNFTTFTTLTNSIIIPNLSPTTGYEIRIRTLCAEGKVTEYSNIFTFSTPILCATPITLTVDRVGLTEMRARWQVRPDVRGFFLEYKEEDSTRYTRLFISDQVEETIKGLKPGTVYDVRLRAICDVGSGVPSNYISTKVKTRLCEQPTITRITNITANSATIEWNPIAGAFEYTIQIRRIGDDRWNNILSVGQTVYTIDGLMTNVEYEVQVWADCFVQNSDPSNISVFQTRPGCAPPAVINSTPSGTSAQVTWTAMPGATGYVVYYRRTMLDNPEQFRTLTVNTNSVTIPNLVSNTPYEVRIVTLCGAGQSGFSNFHDFRTLVNTSCNRPRNLRATTTNGSIRLTWDFMDGVRTYVVQYRRANVQESFMNVTLSSNEATSYTINGLLPSTTYLVVLRVNCASGATEVAQLEVTTPAGKSDNIDETTDNALNLSVYPNPTRGVLNVTFSNPDVTTANLILTDLTGRIVYQSVWTTEQGENNRTLSLTDVTAGVYQMMLNIGGRVHVTKLMVE